MYYSEACMNYPAIILLIEPNTGKIVAANKKAESTYGYSIDKLCTMKISEINVLKPEQIKEEIYNATSELRNYFHFPHKTASGKIINMEVESYPTKIYEKVYLFSVIYPSNERNIFVNASLNLIDKSPDAIMVLDQSNRVIKINKSFEVLFGFEEAMVIGEFGYNLLKDLQKQKYDYLIEELSNGKTENVNFKVIDSYKTYEYILSGIPTFYLNNYFGAVLSIRRSWNQTALEVEKNLNLERKLIEMEKSSSEKDDFLARMSHDMRTPMNAILGIASFGIDEIKDLKALKYFSQIKDSSEYLLALINDILDMQKLENGEIKLENKITQTLQIAKKVRTIIEPRAAQKGINLRFNLECEEMYQFVKVDEKRIEQVLINILNNAIKYTPEGGYVTWNDYVQKMPDGRIKVFHEFSDTGVGMSSEFQKIMFNPFTTEFNSLSKSEGGSGLGLAITKNLIQAMGGKISCKSKIGEGTTFFIEFFLTPATDTEINLFLKKNEDYEGLNILKGKKLLICEDIEINIMIIEKLLSVYDCEIDVARNGLEGVNLARSGKYCAILMDIRMPVMNGLEAAREIRKFDMKVPIIALSANAYLEDVKKSISAGMNAHIAKPINKEELYSKLIKYLNC
ncbi:MAG: response regulator [Sphaerochaetaceae bacterium]